MNDGFIDYVKSDFERVIDNPTFAKCCKCYLFPKGNMIRYQFWLRATHFAKKNKLTKYSLGVLSYWRLRHYEFKYGIHANSNIEIGKGLKIVHDGAVFLNCEKIGKNCTFYPNVMLGGQPEKKGIPIIEDNVTVFTGAVCCGKIVLHSGCQVAANSYVGHDIEANTIVAGLPAKVIRKVGSLS
jgi:serine O-acetyltransferase